MRGNIVMSSIAPATTAGSDTVRRAIDKPAAGSGPRGRVARSPTVQTVLRYGVGVLTVVIAHAFIWLTWRIVEPGRT
jgi:hypothetical protein